MLRVIVCGLFTATLLTLVSAKNPFNEAECLKICRAEPYSAKISWTCRIAGAKEEILRQKRVCQILTFVIAFLAIPLGIYCSIIVWKHTFNLLKRTFYSDEKHLAPLCLTLPTSDKTIEEDQEELKVLRQKLCKELHRANGRAQEEE